MFRNRAVLVYRPTGYEHSEARYPVLYLLDGDAHLLHTAGIIDFLSRNGRMPQMLVVGLPNTDRTRDLTPALTTGADERFPTAGGADAFFDEHPDRRGFLYMTLANEGGDMLTSAEGFTKILAQKAPATFARHFTSHTSSRRLRRRKTRAGRAC